MNALDFGTRPDHVGLHVYHLEEETKWIHDVLDFEFSYRIGLPIGHFPRSAFHTLGDFQYEVYEVRNPLPYSYDDYENTIGVRMAELSVIDWEGWKKNAQDLGVEFVYEDNTPGKEKAVIKDPSDILHEVNRDTLPEDVCMRGRWGIRVSGVKITCQNIEETADWYGEIFGYEGLEILPRKEGYPRIGVTECNHVKLVMIETPEAQPFNLYDFENNIGIKHIDFSMTDRLGWTEWVKDARNRMGVIVSVGHPSIAHYVVDNCGMLTEMSDEHILNPDGTRMDAQ
ncbi:MAG: VOC family protein [Lachnospiraceae bacterium]|nr:VOC family protein [Lachnospiraceae bacterium]MBR6349014.1 VOC family protein [Lachnospiraceae bacterium]